MLDATEILQQLATPLVCFSRNGELSYINRAALALMPSKLSTEELEGLSLSSMLPLLRDNGEPVDTQQLLAAADRPGYLSVILKGGVGRADQAFKLEVSRLSLGEGEGGDHGCLCLHPASVDTELEAEAATGGLDPLTDLFGRREFERRLGNLVDDAAISSRTHALVFLDIDQFKLINDTRGHRAGDNLIKQLAQLLRSELCHGDTVCRLGGDEFGVLLSNVDVFEARSVALRLLRATRQMEFVWQGVRHNVSFSAGVVVIDELAQSPEKVLCQADVAVYAAKEEGRSRAHIYDPSDNKLGRMQDDMLAVQHINMALENNGFFLVKENIYPVKPADHDQVPTGEYMELLLRMRLGGKLYSPGYFMPAAERFGLMPKIDRWVFDELLRYLETHPELGGRDSIYSINLSGQSLCESKFLEFVISKLQSSSADIAQICFEITETVAIRNFELVNDFITRVQAMGGRFALDDFGTGMSSFGYLQQLPVDFVKIDGMFVQDMDRNSIHAALVRSINDISHELGKQTIAEFVEREEIIDCLGDLDVDFFQGHLRGKPQPLMPQAEQRSLASGA